MSRWNSYSYPLQSAPKLLVTNQISRNEADYVELPPRISKQRGVKYAGVTTNTSDMIWFGMRNESGRSVQLDPVSPICPNESLRGTQARVSKRGTPSGPLRPAPAAKVSCQRGIWAGGGGQGSTGLKRYWARDDDERLHCQAKQSIICSELSDTSFIRRILEIIQILFTIFRGHFSIEGALR